MSRSARREQASARPLACPWTTHGCLPGVQASVQVRPPHHRSDSARRITRATALVDRFQTLARTRRAWSPTVSWLSQCALDRMACRRERQAVVRACYEGRHPRIRYAGLPSRSGLGGDRNHGGCRHGAGYASPLLQDAVVARGRRHQLNRRYWTFRCRNFRRTGRSTSSDRREAKRLRT